MTEIMTLNEFKKAIEEWGKSWGIETDVSVEKDWTYIYATRKNEDLSIVEDLGVIAVISNVKVCTLNFSRLETIDLDDAERQTLLEIIKKFASTMLADRKDKEKKYYLRHRFIKSLSEQTYLAKGEKYLWIMNEMKIDADYQQFTLEEIEEIKNKFDTDLKDFEIVEVEPSLYEI